MSTIPLKAAPTPGISRAKEKIGEHYIMPVYSKSGKQLPDGSWDTPSGNHPGGRPLDYKPEFCDIVVSLGKEGKSWAYIAAKLDITRSTLYEWKDTYPEFSDSLNQAREYAQAWWEDLGQDGCTMGKQFNAQGYSLQVRNRFPEDWRERTEQVVDNKREIKAGPELIASLRASIAELIPHLQAKDGKIIDITPRTKTDDAH